MAKPPVKKPKATPEQARQILESQRARIREKYKDDPRKRETALKLFEADPRIQAARRQAGLAPVTTSRLEVENEARKQAGLAPKRVATRKDKIKETARRTIERQKEANKDSWVPEYLRDMGAGMLSGANNGLFGLPARAAAAITGTDNDLMQEYVDQQGQRAPVTNFLGTLGTGLVTGSGAANLVTRGGARLAATASPALQKTGNVLQGLFNFKRGETAKNAGKLALTGAGFGAATEAGRGGDIGTGAVVGAGASVALGGGYKAGQYLFGKAGEVFRTSGANDFFRRYTKTPREVLERRAQEFRDRTGKEPTIYELLDLPDRKALQRLFPRMTPGQQERGADLARKRVEAIPGEVAQVVKEATRGQRKRNIQTLASAQAKARGGQTPTPDEARLAVGAADNPTRLAQLRREEARSIMGPYDARKAVDDFSELIPTTLKPGKKPGEVVEVPNDPEVAAVIRAAAGSARIRPEGEGLTIREITGMITEIKNDLSRGSVIERGVAQRAIDQLEDIIATRHPDVAPALARMNEAWAARSRQIEGMLSTGKQADLNPTNPKNLKRSENIYETPEGATGRAAGQRTELIDDLGAANAPALGTVRQLAESPTTARNIAANIGVPATARITEAARAQSESARRLAAAVKDPNFNPADLEAGDLALLAAGLNPASMAYTKARAAVVAFNRFAQGIGESRSRTLVDMLFSRDPRMTQRAIDALAKAEGGREVLRDIINSAAMMASGGTEDAGGNSDMMLPEEPAAVEDPYAEFSEEVEYPYAEFSEETDDPYAEFSEAPLGEQAVLSVFPDAEITDTLRDPESDLGKKNPGSYHINSEGAVDVRPIPGVSFTEFVETLKAEGYNVVEAIDETKNPSKHATGPHWHIVIE